MVLLKEEEKQLLLDRYLDIAWPDDVSDLRCVRCQRVAINHHLSNCQHLFCNNCRRVFSDGGQWKCPQCQQYVTQLDDQDFDVEIKMHQLRIFCPNKKYGCKYEDQLRNIPKHLMTCVDTREAALPVEYTGTNRIEAVDKQLMKVSEAIGELKEGMSSKFSEQRTKIDDVSSKLNVLTQRVNGMEENSKEYAVECRSIRSVLELVNQRVQQNELHHQQTIERMSLNMEEMRTQMASMTQAMETLQSKESEELNSLKTETYDWTIKDVAKIIPKDHWRFDSEAFKFTGYPYEIRAKLIEEQGGVDISLQFKDGNKVNKFLNNNGFTTVKYIVKDQSNSLKKQHIICECHLQFYDCFGQSGWIFVCGLPNGVLSSPYVKDDCITFTISLEPPSIDHSFVSNNGILKWKLGDYKTRKEEGLYRDNWSPSFYTSPQGFRVRTHLTIFNESIWATVLFLTGEHDDSLSVNFPHKTTVTLFNHTDPSNDLVKSVQREDVDWYEFKLESITFIEENGFVKDDSLLLTVVIEPDAK